MSEETKKLVIDNNSLVNFFNHYFFDRDNGGEVYEKLKNFLIGKISSGEIVVIDKVFDEFTVIRKKEEIKDLKDSIRDYIVDTTDLIDDVQALRDKYYKSENERFYRNGSSEPDYTLIDRILQKYLDKHADLYLVIYCKKNKNTILVTDESTKNDSKILEKIPTICNGEDIDLMDLPDSLFNYYREELQFSLN